eukprot:12437578-Alexandrium_andersonii.AAC.1
MGRALDDAFGLYRVARLRHIRGISNILADALSGQFASEPKPSPSALASAPRAYAPERNESFYRSRKRAEARVRLLRH